MSSTSTTTYDDDTRVEFVNGRPLRVVVAIEDCTGAVHLRKTHRLRYHRAWNAWNLIDPMPTVVEFGGTLVHGCSYLSTALCATGGMVFKPYGVLPPATPRGGAR